jgi:dTDP-4-amino-4,6-dideoxygalactose transaminase
MRIDFSPPFINQSVIDEVVDTLNSGWITTGKKVKLLEDEIQRLSDSSAVLCVNSWTAGAVLSLRWFGLKEGDEVIIPAYTYAATAFAVMRTGAKVVMVDVCDDFNISIEAIKNAITPNTKAIIPVDVAGWPCDYNELLELIHSHEIKSQFKPNSAVQEKLGRILILSDAAHSLGSSYNGLHVGSLADITIFSLHAVKNITTGEGGAVCLNLPFPFNNHQIYTDLRSTSMNCQTKDAYTKYSAGNWRYDIIGLGMKINMPDINASIGLAQMRLFTDLFNKRKEIAMIYNKAFSEFDWALLPPESDAIRETSYHLYPFRIKNITENQRDEIIDEIAKLEVSTNVHFRPLPLLTYFKECGFDIVNFPNAFKNYACEISLPIFPQLGVEQINFIIHAVIASYEKVVLKK